MSGIRDYAIQRWGLDPSASNDELGELLKRQLRRGAITMERVREIQSEHLQERKAAHLGAYRDFLKRHDVSDEDAEDLVSREEGRIGSDCMKTFFLRVKDFASRKFGVEMQGETDEELSDQLEQFCVDKFTLSDILDLQLLDNAKQSTSFATKGETQMKDSTVTPADIFNPGGSAGQPNVKAASARYSTKRYEISGKEDRPMLLKGEAATTMSEREHALNGVWLKQKALAAGIRGAVPLTEHEHELWLEQLNEGLWSGSVTEKSDDIGTKGVKLAVALGRKGTDLVGNGSDGTTSGGTYLVPYYFDTEIIEYALLFGELAPMVEQKDLPSSNSVHIPSINNLTGVTWNGSEGSGSAIGLQTTDSLVGNITENVYNLGLSITLGRDLLADSPINLSMEITKLFGPEFAYQTDKVIAVGANASNQPNGLTNTSGVNVANSASGTGGPYKVADVEKLLSSLPKQYRRKGDTSVCFVMNDAAWWLLRGLSVSSTDQRRILGYDYENYLLANRPVKIQNDIPAGTIMLGPLRLYRRYVRKGLQIEMSNEGKTLRLDNEFLITGRARMAGVHTNGAGLSVMTDGALA